MLRKEKNLYLLFSLISGYPVSGKVTGQISGQISIRYNPTPFPLPPFSPPSSPIFDISYTSLPLLPVLRIRIRMNPFHFGQPDPNPIRFNETDPRRVAKNQPKSWKISSKIIRISYIFFKTIIIKLMFTDLNIYPTYNKTDHISEKYIFYIKKSKTKVDIFPILGRIWIRVRYFTKRIRGSGSISKWNESATLLTGLGSVKDYLNPQPHL